MQRSKRVDLVVGCLLIPLFLACSASPQSGPVQTAQPSPAPTQAPSPTPPPTLTPTASPAPTVTLTATATEVPALTLSLDSAHPTRLAFDQLFGPHKIKLLPGDGFKFTREKGTWDQIPAEWKSKAEAASRLPSWIDPKLHSLSINQIPGEIYQANVHVDGYIQTAAPNGEEWIVVQESWLGLDGKVVPLKFPFPLNNPFVKKAWKAWFDPARPYGEIIFIPMTYTLAPDDPGFFCSGTASEFICAGRNLKDAQALAEFLKSGSLPPELGDGWLVPEPTLLQLSGGK